jgi:hypothetical protein
VPFDAAGAPGTPVARFDARWYDYDVLAEGQFVAVVSDTSAGYEPLTVLLNWPRTLAR